MSKIQVLILIIFLIALGFTGFQIFNTVTLLQTNQNARRQVNIQKWMTIPYLAHANRVDPNVLYQALDLPPEPHDRRSLNRIAKIQNRPVEEIIKTIEAAIANEKLSNPAPNTKGAAG